ncbi:DUF4212 domain-containing protein [Thermus sp.]|uniref:DUF4212 domain-containing protein n=1 Tax=Thermus sp. TaxID=275 RepID=UPI00307F44FB
MEGTRLVEYWKKNVALIRNLLIVWALVSYVLGILLAEPLSGVRLGSLPLGFWFAQQGSIYIFVILIFYYAWRMDQLDREHHVHE